MINIFFFSFISIIKPSFNSEIHLTISGRGDQQILNENFNKIPNEVKVNGNTRTGCHNICNLNSVTNNIILKFNSAITSCENMFLGSNNIIQIDLSDFDSTQVTSMKNMFSGCTNLRKINFGNMDT